MNRSTNDQQLIRAAREEGAKSSGNTGKGAIHPPGEWTEAWLAEMWCGFSLEEGEFAFKTGGMGSSREASPAQGHAGVKSLLEAGAGDKDASGTSHLSHISQEVGGWPHGGIETLNHNEERKSS